MEWMTLPLKRYAVFRGRSRRKEFWMWILFVIITSVVLSVLDHVLGLGGGGVTGAGGIAYGARVNGGVLTGLFTLAIFLPNLAVQVRRLHDVDRSGWWLLLPVAPYVVGIVLMLGGGFGGSPALLAIGGAMLVGGLICAILLLVWFCMDGTRGPNRFGEDPKRVGSDLRDVFG